MCRKRESIANLFFSVRIFSYARAAVAAAVDVVDRVEILLHLAAPAEASLPTQQKETSIFLQAFVLDPSSSNPMRKLGGGRNESWVPFGSHTHIRGGSVLCDSPIERACHHLAILSTPTELMLPTCLCLLKFMLFGLDFPKTLT